MAPSRPAHPKGPSLLEEIRQYLRFGPADLARLRAVAPQLEPFLEEMAETFYESIQRNARAAQVLREGPDQVDRLREKLVHWTRSLLTDARDIRYAEARSRIGVKHVQLGLEPRYVVGAIHLIRGFLSTRIREVLAGSPETDATLDSLHVALDLDLSLINERFFVRRQEAAVQSRDLAIDVLRRVQDLLLRGGHSLVNLDALRREIGRLLPVDRVVVILDRPEDDCLEVLGVSGTVEVPQVSAGQRIARGASRFEEVVTTGLTLVLRLDRSDRHPIHQTLHAHGIRSIIVLPLWVEERVIGTLNLASTEPEPPPDTDFLGAISDSVAMAVAHFEALRRLVRSEEKYRSLFEAVTDGLFVVDSSDRYVMMNPVFGQLVGRTADQVIGRSVAEVYPSGTAEVVAALHGQVFATGRPVVSQVAIEVGDRLRWLSVSYGPLRDGQGRITGLTGLARDVTGERQRAAEQAHQHKMAILGLLASGIAHEVNNPLASIATIAKNLEETTDDPAVRDMLARIIRGTQGVGQALGTILAFARPSGQEADIVALNEVVERALGLASFDPRAATVPIVRHLDPALPWVLGNADRLCQVVLNLLLNAIDAMEGRAGAITVRTSARAEGVRLAVSDDGPGVRPEMSTRIFEPFYSTKASDRGTGLGLFVSGQIVKDHGGTLTVDSRPGLGATFVVSLPRPTKA